MKREFVESMGFGARLAEERKRLGLKQAEFAALVGTDVPKQSLYENDRRELRADYLARLADALGRGGGALVVDEAFMDVVLPSASLATRLPAARTLVLRSFGKAFGLAGLRLGFAIVTADVNWSRQ